MALLRERDLIVDIHGRGMFIAPDSRKANWPAAE
jgi:hypothetical protein